jgi:hypothetical protein
VTKAEIDQMLDMLSTVIVKARASS